MNEKRIALLSAFNELSRLLVLHGTRPADFWRGFKNELYPEIQNVLEKAFELYDDSLVELPIDIDLDTVEQLLCETKHGEERTQCIKRIRMLVALDEYMILHQDNLLDPQLWNQSPLLAKYPEIRSILDEDGLFDIANAQMVDSERVRYQDDVFFFHPELTFHFLQEFSRFCSAEGKCKKRVALDPRRILPARHYPIRLLEAYWYGPKFNLDDVDAQIHGIEFTVHARMPDSPRRLLGAHLERTEFMWSMQDNLKTLQIEELVAIEENSARVKTRYIHTIRDVTRHTFVHLDGAIRWYSHENYLRRFDDKLSNHPNADGYFKLFRIDGELSDQDWLDLIANYYSGNELIHEYFGQPM
jgi:hypothetical protein